MRFTRFFILSVVFLYLTHAKAQPSASQPLIEKPYIEVTGTAIREVIPDEIYIRITLKERERNTIAQQEEKMKSAISQAGINVSNLSLSDANVAYVRVGWTSKDIINHKNYLLKVSTATEVRRVFQELSSASVNEAEIAKVSHSQIESIRKEVRIQAMKAAKEKADYLLAAVGEKTGKSLEIREQNNTTHSRQENQVENYRYNYNKSSGLEKELEFSAFEVRYSIYAKFAIQ